MGMCFAPDCRHYSERDVCKFYRFPKGDIEKKRWIKLIRRQDRDPSDGSRICSCHFENSNRENGPTLFTHNIGKRFRFESPEKKSKTRKIISNVVSEEPSCNDLQVKKVLPQEKSSILIDAENYFLEKKVNDLTTTIKKLEIAFSFKHISTNDDLVMLYTGLPNKHVFNVLFDLLTKVEHTYYSGWNVIAIEPQDQLFMTLYKLRLNTPYKDVAFRFNCSTGTVTNIFMTWLHLLYEIMFKTLMVAVPSRTDNAASLPACFSAFPNTRMVIDCTEIFSEVPTSMLKQKELYSNYKHRNTLKGLIGIAPNGVVTYVSDLYPGSVSDKRIVENCGVLEVFQPGDLIIADKGFLIADILPPGVSFNIPPFLLQPQFTEDQVIQTRTIARARIHVERAICRIKEYSILSLIPQNLLSKANKIWKVCSVLTNLQLPLLKEVYENSNT